jgi:hypothetical protein
MKRFYIPLLLIFFLITACNKDEFPDEFSLIGAWIEQTADTNKTEIEFKNGNRVFLKKASLQIADTLRYRLDKEDELQLYLPAEYPDGSRTYHKLRYSQKKKELTIFDLFPSQPAEPTEIVFKKK